MSYEITEIETVYEGWGKFVIAIVRLPDGRETRLQIEDHGDAVAVLPYDSDRKTAIVIGQFRAPVMYVSGEQQILEAIAGRIDSDDAQTAVRREAHEEAGLTLERLELVTTAWTMPGVSTERTTLFFARYSEVCRTSRGGGLDHEMEKITVVELSLRDLAARADHGEIADMKLLLLVQTLRIRNPGLFQ
jgi:nudix-type nucleoside diphosphatase (YffH/AdpP family)